MTPIERLKTLDPSRWEAKRYYVPQQGGGPDEWTISASYGIGEKNAKLGTQFLQLAPQLLALWDSVNATEDGIVCCCPEILTALNDLNIRTAELMGGHDEQA